MRYVYKGGSFAGFILKPKSLSDSRYPSALLLYYKMGLTFKFPSHPPKATNLRQPGSTLRVNIQTERDPHTMPTFYTNTPILYLPPLLSSLPQILLSHSSYPLKNATRLPDIGVASLSLHKALHHFRPLTDAYADMPYTKGFNWDDLELPENDEGEWYIVVFRIKRKDGRDGGCQPSDFPL